MIDNKKIGQQLKELRMAKGLRQVDVAEKVGVSRAAISNIETGTRSLTLSTLNSFCELYNIDISYFGIETEAYDEMVDLTIRIEKVFQDESIDESKKDELCRTIMQMYLDSKK